MFETRNLVLPLIAPSQAQKHVTHNEALRRLDALVQLGVVARDLAAPPANPADGDRYIVADDPSGAWLGQAGRVAAWQDGAWAFFEPRTGWIVYVGAENAALVHDGTGWTAEAFAGAISGAPLFGINADADTYNRLFVKSNALLFSHDDVSGSGNGSILGSFNKAGPGADAGFNFQTGYSTRALMGLYGNDDFRIKVTPDGSTYFDALVIDRATGAVALPATQTPAIGVNANGAEVIATGTSVDLQGFVPEFDQLGDSSFSAGVLTIGAGDAGLWSFGFTGYLDDTAPTVAVDLLLNGNVRVSERVGGAHRHSFNLASVLPCAAGDSVHVRCFHDGGADRHLDPTSRFFAWRIGS